MAYEARRYGDSMLFRNTSRGAKYYVDLEAHLNITTSQNSVTELKSSVDITWNNVRQKKNTLKNEVNELALTYEFLEPYHERKCKQHYNCLGCLSDNSCGWCVETRTCILRDRNTSEEEGDVIEGSSQKVITPTVDKCSGDMKSHLLITNMAECPVCTDYVSCVDCANVSIYSLLASFDILHIQTYIWVVNFHIKKSYCKWHTRNKIELRCWIVFQCFSFKILSFYLKISIIIYHLSW